jgi:hypothetical protein
VSTEPNKKNARFGRSILAGKIKIFDGGNLAVFVPRRNRSATAIPCFNSFGDGDLDFHRDA